MASRSCGGAMIIEAVIAMVLLSTATLALTKLATSSVALSKQSDERLTATLAAENTIERLRGIDFGELMQQADMVAQSVGQDAACDVKVSGEPFTAGDRQGIHVRVEVSSSPAVRITLHEWRIAAESQSESDADSTVDSSTEEDDSDETETEDGQSGKTENEETENEKTEQEDAEADDAATDEAEADGSDDV